MSEFTETPEDSLQEDRIIRANRAVEAYAALSGGGSFDEVISDLITDLMHFVDHIDLVETDGQGFDDLLARAELNYSEEIEEEE